GERATLLPVPLLNVINGGRHATNPLDFQEFMIVPHGAPSFPEAIREGVEVYQALRRLLDQRGLTTAVGDEGGFAPALASHEQALDLLVEAIGAAGLTPGRDVSLALDPAASELASDGGYVFRRSSGKRCGADGQIKTGAPCRSERTAKYNRLLAIAEELGASARYVDPFTGRLA